MHIASSISVQYPQPDPGKNRIPNVKEKQIHGDPSEWVPKRKRRVRSRLSAFRSTLWLTADGLGPAGQPE